MSSSSPAAAGPLHSHSGPAVTLDGMDIEKFVTYSLLATSILAASVVIAPLALPALGVGDEVEKQLLKECCDNIPAHTGITEGITKLIQDIPVVGTYLNTASGANLLAPAAVMLGGHAAGSLVQHFEKENGHSGVIGTMIRVSSMALGVILSLPALLPGLAHGTLFLGRLTGFEAYADPIAKGIGTNNCAVLQPDFTKGEHAFGAVVGAKSSASLLVGHAACIAPALMTLGTTAGHAGSKAGKVLAERQEQAVHPTR